VTAKIFCGVEKDKAKAPVYPKWAAEAKELAQITS
jgi:hypothetical protein